MTIDVDGILQLSALATVIMAITGNYFYFKFKVAQMDREIKQEKQIRKEEKEIIEAKIAEELAHIKAGKVAMKKELELRIKEHKEDQSKVNDELKSELKSLNDKIDKLPAAILQLLDNRK